MASAVTTSTTPTTRRSLAACERTSRIRAVRRCPSTAKTSRGTATPTAKAAVSTKAERPKRWVALTTVMAARTGPAQGTNTRPALGALPSPTEPGEGHLQEVTERRDDQSQPYDAEDEQPDPSQRVLGQAEGAQEPRSDQREHREAQYQPTHHRERPPAPAQL